MQCEKCKKEFPEEELDLFHGKWLCHNCEEMYDHSPGTEKF